MMGRAPAVSVEATVLQHQGLLIDNKSKFISLWIIPVNTPVHSINFNNPLPRD